MSENHEHLPIHLWSEQDRPREKLKKLGRKNLSDAELIAILLGNGSKKESAVELAKKILFKFKGDLHQLSEAGLSELTCFHGMGETKALILMACFELSHRKVLTTSDPVKCVRSSEDAYQVILPKLSNLQHEEFWVLYMNINNRVVALEKISQGGLNGTIADARIIFRKALEHRSSGVILFHNHPSGSLKPSEADIKLTHRIREAGRMLEVAVTDHVIVSSEGYYSFADHNLM